MRSLARVTTARARLGCTASSLTCAISPKNPELGDNMPMTKLLVFAGSTRQQSFNRQLAHAAAHLARASGAEVTHLELSSHPAWIIVSPEYNGSYTALLKNTIDWASSPVKNHPVWSSGTKPFEGKVVGLLSASPGALGGLRSLSHLNPLLQNLHCWICPQQFALGRAGEAFDEQGAFKTDFNRKSTQAVVDQTLWAAARLSS